MPVGTASRDRATPSSSQTTDEPAVLLRRGVRRGVRGDAAAFAYSVLITVTYGVVSLQVGGVSVVRLFLFALGATVGFTLWEAIASRGFRVRIREEASDVVLFGTALAPLSVTIGLAAALGTAALVPDGWAWALAPLAATIVYVLMTGAQLAVARWYEQSHPPDEEE